MVSAGCTPSVEWVTVSTKTQTEVSRRATGRSGECSRLMTILPVFSPVGTGNITE